MTAAVRGGRIASLHPAYFALVMATGIVSIAADLVGMPEIARVLFGLNLLFYPVLVVLTGIRIARYRDRVVADLLDHGRSVGFFTTVAATCVLGSQFVVVAGLWRPAAFLWTVGILLWGVITYGVLALLTVKEHKPPMPEGLSGGWLVTVVAAQSVSVLGTQLATEFGSREPLVLFVSLLLWLGGGMLYIWIMSLIFFRYTFFVMEPSDLGPPYWINMGAVAISTLAGALLVAAAPASALLAELTPFLKGMTLLFWATATWWIPMLVILGIWRHLIRRFPFRYDPLYWGAVFPLGMYTVSTYRLGQIIDVPEIMAIPPLFIWIALLAWTVTMVGLVRDLFPRSALTGSR
jgi:tellurite resistance protein TehA-like permease